MIAGERPDYLAVGHICYDLVSNSKVMGGAAAYATATASVLGCRAAALTSSAARDDWGSYLPHVRIERIVAPQTTLFENVYEPGGRVQTVHAVAGPLGATALPDGWSRAPIVHLAPIANEVDATMATLFSNGLLGISPQGWMRRWDESGRVYAVPWADATSILPLAAATFLSVEDLSSPSDLDTYCEAANLLVLTEGAAGCTVYWQDQVRQFAAPDTVPLESTGAGDIFAAAFLVRLWQTDGDPWAAAEFANTIAARSVSQQGFAAKMAAIESLVLADLERANREAPS